jgi:hypothetical protein
LSGGNRDDHHITGCRVLVVEDETLIAFEIEAALEALGCEIVGPENTLEAALRLAKAAALDAAILDVTIRGGKNYPMPSNLSPAHPVRAVQRLWGLGAPAFTPRPPPPQQALHGSRTGRAGKISMR